MFWSEVALFGIFLVYTKRLTSPLEERCKYCNCSREHSKGPACLPWNHSRAPPQPMFQPGQSLSRVSESIHAPMDFGAQSFLMRNAGLRLSSGLSQGWLCVITQNSLQMSPPLEAFSEDNLHQAITLPCFIHNTYDQKLHYLFTNNPHTKVTRS